MIGNHWRLAGPIFLMIPLVEPISELMSAESRTCKKGMT
jgi:hypothetical protein